MKRDKGMSLSVEADSDFRHGYPIIHPAMPSQAGGDKR